MAVLVAFADKLGKGEDELLRLGSGFGAGMGTMEGTCGALVGAIMVSSLLSDNGEAMANSRSIVPRFKELCGATVCRDIKGTDTGKVLCSCEDCVRNSTEVVAEQMDKQQAAIPLNMDCRRGYGSDQSKNQNSVLFVRTSGLFCLFFLGEIIIPYFSDCRLSLRRLLIIG